jgi:hypothetical protein
VCVWCGGYRCVFIDDGRRLLSRHSTISHWPAFLMGSWRFAYGSPPPKVWCGDSRQRSSASSVGPPPTSSVGPLLFSWIVHLFEKMAAYLFFSLLLCSPVPVAVRSTVFAFRRLPPSGCPFFPERAVTRETRNRHLPAPAPFLMSSQRKSLLFFIPCLVPMVVLARVRAPAAKHRERDKQRPRQREPRKAADKMLLKRSLCALGFGSRAHSSGRGKKGAP